VTPVETILRKGSVATDVHNFLVPLNMRDGTLVYWGLYFNPEWNYSGPHGAGRKMSRSGAKKALQLEDFKESMKGIWSKSVGQSTLDEAPMAYKDGQSIEDALVGQYELADHLIPVFNFKASDEVE
jgi:RNA-splicing ligase RtcB